MQNFTPVSHQQMQDVEDYVESWPIRQNYLCLLLPVGLVALLVLIVVIVSVVL